MINGTTATSVNITNTSNEQIINLTLSEGQGGWQVGNIPSPYNNSIEIQVTLGSGTASVTITQVTILEVLNIQGGSSGTTVSLDYSGTFDYYNEDPSIIIAPLEKVAIGYWGYVQAISGETTISIQGNGSSQSEISGTGAISNTQNANVTGNSASGTITISVPANGYIQLINWFAFVSYLGRHGVTFPDGRTAGDGSIGFVKGVVYLLEGYFMFNPEINYYATSLESGAYVNLVNKIQGNNFYAFAQGLVQYPQIYNTALTNQVPTPITPNNIYCCNILALWFGGSNQGEINYFTAVFNADDSVFHQCCEEWHNLLIIQAEVIV